MNKELIFKIIDVKKNNMFTKKHFLYLYIFVKSKTKRKDTYVNM